MCYSFNNKGLSLKKAMKDLEAESNEIEFKLNGEISAFQKQYIPMIANYNGIVLLNAFWGTIENPSAVTKGKNLKSENTDTLYKKIISNRCLIPVSSYYEFQTVFNPLKKAPTKVKHEFFWKGKKQFYIAGLFDRYENGDLGFGLLTTIPNEVQANVHSRMVISLDAAQGRDYLRQKPIKEFQFPNYSPQLEVVNLEPTKIMPSLFD